MQAIPDGKPRVALRHFFDKDTIICARVQFPQRRVESARIVGGIGGNGVPSLMPERDGGAFRRCDDRDG